MVNNKLAIMAVLHLHKGFRGRDRISISQASRHDKGVVAFYITCFHHDKDGVAFYITDFQYNGGVAIHKTEIIKLIL